MKPDFTEDILLAPPEEPVCWCSGVSKGTVLAAAAAGARTLAKIRERTGACTLGRCREMNSRGR